MRMITISRSALLLVLALSPVHAPAAPENHDAPPPNWIGGSITTSRTLTVAAPGPEWVVYGDVVVEPGVTLTVQPGVTLRFIDDSDFFASGGYVDKSELVIRGTLVASGTPADSIVFRGTTPTSPNRWGEIRIEGSGQATITHARISSAASGVVVSGGGAEATLDHVTINVGGTGISSTGTLNLTDSEVAAVSTGILSHGAGSAEIAGARVGGGQYGMRLGVGHVQRSVVLGASIAGIAIIGNAVSFLPEDSTDVVPTEVYGCPTGISVDEFMGAVGPLTIRNVIVRDCGNYGIDVSRTDDVTIDYSTIAYCGTGVGSYQGRTRVLNSIVAYNSTALLFLGSCADAVDYTDLWGGTSNLPPCAGTLGDHVAVFDPGFVNPGARDFHLLPSSMFTDYSVSGGQIGAYGPGPTTGLTGVRGRDAGAGRLTIQPNPSADGRFAFRLDVASPGPIQVRLLDLAGRVLLERAFESSARGPLLFDLTGREGLPGGVYFVQVEGGGRTVGARAVVIR